MCARQVSRNPGNFYGLCSKGEIYLVKSLILAPDLIYFAHAVQQIDFFYKMTL
jgi:hypothetical protein